MILVLVCESYIKSKITKNSSTTKGHKTKEYLELVYTYVCDPFNIHACEEYEYFIIFIDYYSKYCYVDLMHRKSNVLEKFKKFKLESKKQLGKHLKAHWLDWSGEYMFDVFDSCLKKHLIIS